MASFAGESRPVPRRRARQPVYARIRAAERIMQREVEAAFARDLALLSSGLVDRPLTRCRHNLRRCVLCGVGLELPTLTGNDPSPLKRNDDQKLPF